MNSNAPPKEFRAHEERSMNTHHLFIYSSKAIRLDRDSVKRATTTIAKAFLSVSAAVIFWGITLRLRKYKL